MLATMALSRRRLLATMIWQDSMNVRSGEMFTIAASTSMKAQVVSMRTKKSSGGDAWGVGCVKCSIVADISEGTQIASSTPV